MDEPRLALLQGDLQGQWEIVDGVFSRIAARHGRIAARQGRRSASVEQVEALAYQLHNLYGACEQLFELIARAFENQIDGARYHVDLLRRMKSEIAGVRPALLTEELAAALNELRGFRHFFRHAYHADLDAERVTALADKELGLQGALRAAVDRFLARLGAGGADDG